jgi:membrane protein
VLTHLSDRDGNLLASGMSYQSIFAVFAAVWVLFSIAGLVLGSNQVLTQALIHSINAAVPGLIGAKGAIDPKSLLNSGALSWTGLVALVGLLWTAIGWMSYTREAVRLIFDLGKDTRNFIVQKGTDLGLALAFGILLIASAALTVASGAALDFVFSLFGIGTHSAWATITAGAIGIILSIALYAVVLGSMYRVLSHIRIPFRSLAAGSVLGAVALVIMSSLSGLLLRGASKNPLLASFVVFVALLIWFNLICQVILLAASWIAVGMADQGISAKDPEVARADRLRRLHQARILVAEAQIADARGRLDRAHGLGKVFARRRLRAAALRRHELVTRGPKEEAESRVGGTR